MRHFPSSEVIDVLVSAILLFGAFLFFLNEELGEATLTLLVAGLHLLKNVLRFSRVKRLKFVVSMLKLFETNLRYEFIFFMVIMVGFSLLIIDQFYNIDVFKEQPILEDIVKTISFILGGVFWIFVIARSFTFGGLQEESVPDDELHLKYRFYFVFAVTTLCISYTAWMIAFDHANFDLSSRLKQIVMNVMFPPATPPPAVTTAKEITREVIANWFLCLSMISVAWVLALGLILRIRERQLRFESQPQSADADI